MKDNIKIKIIMCLMVFAACMVCVSSLANNKIPSNSEDKTESSLEPVITDILICNYIGHYYLQIVTDQPNATFVWEASAVTLCDWIYPDDASFIEHPNIFKGVKDIIPSFTVSVYGINGTHIGPVFTKTVNVPEF